MLSLDSVGAFGLFRGSLPSPPQLTQEDGPRTSSKHFDSVRVRPPSAGLLTSTPRCPVASQRNQTAVLRPRCPALFLNRIRPISWSPDLAAAPAPSSFCVSKQSRQDMTGLQSVDFSEIGHRSGGARCPVAGCGSGRRQLGARGSSGHGQQLPGGTGEDSATNGPSK